MKNAICQRATWLAVCLSIAAMCSATPGRAQSPSSWTTLSPPGGVDPAKFTRGATVAVYRDGLYMRVYSAITRQWYAHAPSFGTSQQIEDHLVAVPESDRWTAFSPFRGTFATQLVPYSASTWDISAGLFVVRHNDTAHVFSAYTGTWSTHAVPATWSMSLHDRICVFADSTYSGPTEGAAIFDAFRSQWHDLPARPGALRVRVNGGSAMLLFANETIGFSAQRGALDVLPVATNLSGGTIVENDRTDLIQYRGAVYCGLNGQFAQTPYPTYTFGNSPSYELSGMLVRGAAAGQPMHVIGTGGSWVPLPAGATGNVGGVAVGMFQDGGTTLGFSAVTNQLAPLPGTPPGTGSVGGDHVAVGTDSSGQMWLFSGLTGQWYPAPAGAQSPWSFGDDGAILSTSGGLVGFSAHDGAFVPLPMPGLQLVYGLSTALAAYDATTMHVFDAARSRWLAVPIAVGSQAPQVSSVGWASSVLLAQEGNRLLGYSARTGRVEERVTSEPVLDRGVWRQFAWARTASRLHMFSEFGEHTSWQGLPHDLVAIGRGSALRHQLLLDSGEFALVGFGPRAPAGISLPPFGQLWLDPAATSLALYGQSGAGHTLDFTVTIPALPVFAGSEWFVQPLFLRAAGATYLAEPTTFRVF